MDNGVFAVTKQIVKDAVDAKCLEGVISADMKLYTMDIIFKKN